MRARIINPSTSRLKSREIVEQDILNQFSIEYGLMSVPAVSLSLPIAYSKSIDGNSIIAIYADDFVYEGYVLDKTSSFTTKTIEVKTSHIVGMLSKRKIPTNVTVKDKSAKEVIDQARSFWSNEQETKDLVNRFTFNYVDDYAQNTKLEYEFSNESMLDFLTKVCEKTTSLFWRVNRYDPQVIDFGLFGKNSNILIDEANYLVSLDDIQEDFSDVVNKAVVMSDKSDGGASTLTLRDIFYNKDLMIKGFPVVMTGNSVNTQRQYDYPQIPIFAPEIIGDEFALIDEEGIALEAGAIYWGTVSLNDTQAVAEKNKEVTDEDRINVTKQLYYSAIRVLKNSRRKILYNLTIEPLPYRSLQVGDKVMFSLNEGVYTLTPCSSYYEKILKENSWFYVTKLTDEYSEGNSRVQRIELSKFLYSERDTTAEQ